MLPRWIHNIENNNETIYRMLKGMRKINLKILNYMFMYHVGRRKRGHIYPEFYGLSQYKNKFDKKRCFIIATGPSLNIQDVENLDKEYTFAMNSLCLTFESTKWRPTFLGIQDEKVYAKLEKDLISHKDDCTYLVGSNLGNKFSVPDNWIQFPLNTYYMLYDLRYNNKYYANFSDDCYNIVYDGYTITYSLIQIAVYMGFKEIYLLGCDCNYEVDKKNHFIEHGVTDPLQMLVSAGDRMNVAYKVAKEYADSNNIHIYNATRGGMLEVFPRVDLDEVLGFKEKE